MPDQPAPNAAPAGAASAVPTPPAPPASVLSTAALVLVADWAVLGVLTDSIGLPYVSLVAAGIILAWRFWPGSPASALNNATGQYLLGLVIVLGAGLYLVEDARGLVSHFNTDILVWAGWALHAVAGLMAWTAIMRIKA